MARQIERDTFFNELIVSFPMLESKIKEEDSDLIHMRMERFSDYTIEQIEKQNIEELIKCFDFQESRIELLSTELLNALTVSYCESLMLGKCSSKMKDIKIFMPPKLKTVYLNYEKRYNEIVDKQNKK